MSDETLRALAAVFDDEWEGTFAKDVARAIDAHIRAVVAEMVYQRSPDTPEPRIGLVGKDVLFPDTNAPTGTVTVTHARWEVLLAERDAALARAEAAEAQRDELARIVANVQAHLAVRKLHIPACRWAADELEEALARLSPKPGG